MKFKKIVFLIISIIFFITGCNSKKDEKGTKTTEISNKLVLKTLDDKLKINIEKIDKKIIIKEFKDKIVLINFWATWCPPCKAEIPHLVALTKKYPNNFKVIGINLGKEDGTLLTKEELQSFILKNHINYTITNDKNNINLAKIMDDVTVIPTMFLIDKNGKIFQKYVGVVPEEMIDTDINRILRK